MKKAIIYSVHGDKHTIEVFKFANQTRSVITNDVALVLHTTPDFSLPENSPFDNIVTQEIKDHINVKYRFKIDGMIYACESLDFDRFLFLDSDACLMKPDALEVFELLDQFDLAAAHAPVRHAWRPEYNPKLDGFNVPLCYPEFNSGVILFKKNCVSTFKKWLDLYLESSKKHNSDQGGFRAAVYFSNLRIATLTPEFNDRRRIIRDSSFIAHPTSRDIQLHK